MAAAPAAAQVCLPRAVIVQRLAEGYSEHPAWQGLVNTGALLEIFTAPGGETWSLVITYAWGVSFQPAPAAADAGPIGTRRACYD